MKTLKILGVIYLISNVFGGYSRIGPTVRIAQGLVRGYWAETNDYYIFEEIPYALVDSNNPFGPAEPYPSFGKNIFNGYKGRVKMCHQMNVPKKFRSHNETLDCLRLNIFVPPKANSKLSLPILVWIHGGSFEHGFSWQYFAANLVRQGMIVVIINYRLGPFGFLCLDTPLVPGNQGLKDQYAAIKWVKNNIAAFGGNPNEITIAGQGAGSCSVLLHLYSPKEKLFKRVIVQSGTPQSEGMFVQPDYKAAIKLATYLGYNTSDTEQALKFLAQKSPESIINATERLSLILRPCKEKYFTGVDNLVIDSAFSLSNKKKVMGTPIMIGHTDQEVCQLQIRGDDYFKSDPFYLKIKSNFNLSDDQVVEAAKSVRHMYIGEQQVTKDEKNGLWVFESDFVYNYPIHRTINNLINEGANPIYKYVFNFKPGHSSELPYLFNICCPLLNAVSTCNSSNDEDVKLMTRHMTTLWANFVKYGNPTPKKTKELPLIWEPVTTDTRPYLDINKELKMKERYSEERMTFWDFFYSKYGHNTVLAR